MHKLAYF